MHALASTLPVEPASYPQQPGREGGLHGLCMPAAVMRWSRRVVKPHSHDEVEFLK